MEHYDFVIAQAEEIARRRRQEEVEDNDLLSNQSDGELSVLASSLSNSMEGIESSQGISVESGDEEMGAIGSGSSVQDPVISPRCTRSGKVLERRED
jgi:hypothetical protein